MSGRRKKTEREGEELGKIREKPIEKEMGKDRKKVVVSGYGPTIQDASVSLSPDQMDSDRYFIHGVHVFSKWASLSLWIATIRSLLMIQVNFAFKRSKGITGNLQDLAMDNLAAIMMNEIKHMS